MNKKQHYIQSAIASIFFVAAFAFLVSGNSLSNHFGVSQKAAARDFDWKAFYAIESLYIYDAGTDKPVRELKDGDVINVNDFKDGYTIIAKTTPSVLSVKFDVDGYEDFRKDNWPEFSASYEIWGNFYALELPLGKHVMTATPYSNKRAKGFEGDPVTYTWTLVDQSDPI
jgi:hypothetical protein